MKFTHEQISEIISSFTNGKDGFEELIRLGMESLMKSEREVYNTQKEDVSNGFRDRRVYHNGKMFEIRFPRTRESNFYPVLLGVLKDQESEVQRGVKDINLFVCDGLSGIENSITNSFPKADIQLCTVHLKRNILNKIKPRDKKTVAAELQTISTPSEFRYEP